MQVISVYQPIGYAGFWRRFLAYLIDTVVLTVAGSVVGAVVGFVIGFISGVQGTDIETTQVVAGVVVYIICLIMGWLYYTLFEGSAHQATLGKMALGIIVTDLNGRQISFGRANGRYWGKIISALILLIGFIMAGFTQKKQALHDIMAGTLVVIKPLDKKRQ